MPDQRNRQSLPEVPTGEAWQAVGGLSYTLKELHNRGDLTDYGHASMSDHLDKIRAALTALETRDRLMAAVVDGVADKWDNIHTHYGFTDDCRACSAFAMLTQSQALNG